MNPKLLFFKHLAPTSDAPLALEIESAEGMYFTTTDGKKILDLIAGISVSVLGHRHPTVEDAVQSQVKKYWHTMVYGEFVLSPQVAYAKALTDNLPAKLNSVYFTNSGTEAIEGAMKLAKRVTGRKKFVAARNAYHGSTQGAMSLNSSDYFTEAYKPLLPNIEWLNYNAFEDLILIDENTAAVIIETVQAESGINPPSVNYLEAMYARCKQVGALLILDEAQAGFGRTGKLWGFCHSYIHPDILVLAKSLGGGFPLGAFISSNKLMQTLSENPVLGHITTFGGHPVSCAAGLATFNTLIESNLIAQCEAKRQLFLKNLKHPKIKTIRSIGLWLAVELDSFDAVKHVITYCLQHGVLTDWFLFNDKCLRIAPPLIITENEILMACKVICEGLDSL